MQLTQKQQSGKQAKGTVGIEAYQGRLRLRLPRQLYGGKQKYLTLGLSDTPENRAIGEAKAKAIESDITLDRFDHSLERYKPQRHLALVEGNEKSPEDLFDKLDKMQDLADSFSGRMIDFHSGRSTSPFISKSKISGRSNPGVKPSDKPPGLSVIKTKTVSSSDLWQKYSLFKAPRLATCTKSKYQSVASLLKKHGKPINTEEDVQDYVEFERSLGNSEQTIKDRLVLLKACYNWGIKKRIVSENPFADSLELVRPRDRSKPDPFTLEEVKQIKSAFSTDRYYKHYFNFVNFLFMTGCRTSEAIGLQWKHVAADFSYILFEESLTRGERKATKTNKSRVFPCNCQLQDFFHSLKPIDALLDDLVFPSPEGTSIDDHNFSQRAWKRILEKAGIRHRKQYNTRHTFISHCIANGVEPTKVAELVGNTVEVIYDRYAAKIDAVEVPTLY